MRRIAKSLRTTGLAHRLKIISIALVPPEAVRAKVWTTINKTSRCCHPNDIAAALAPLEVVRAELRTTINMTSKTLHSNEIANLKHTFYCRSRGLKRHFLWAHGFGKKSISTNPVNTNKFIFVAALPVKTDTGVMSTFFRIFGVVTNEWGLDSVTE